jgi:deoxyadenosine/deoxycytidine kinase
MSYISLSGNIAVGKSTVLSGLESNGFEVVYENLGPKFLSFLDSYNNDPRSAIHLQTYINDYRLIDAEVSCVTDGLFVHERSMIDDMIFTTYMICKGEIDEEVGNEFLDRSLQRLIQYPPSKVIYLYSDPESTYGRLVGRGRPEESKQNLLKIAELEQSHQTLLPMICEEVGIDLVEVDWSDFGSIETIIDLI